MELTYCRVVRRASSQLFFVAVVARPLAARPLLACCLLPLGASRCIDTGTLATSLT